MFDAGDNWLADLLNEGKLLEAWRELVNNVQYLGLATFWKRGFLQAAGRRFLNIFPGIMRMYFRRTTLPDWLSIYSSDLLRKNNDDGGSNLKPTNMMLDDEIAQISSRERFYAGRYGIEIRRPFRNRRLVEFALALPAYQLYRHGLYKHILRTAMQGILPETVRTRERKTALNSLFFRGLEREKISLNAYLQDPSLDWWVYIRTDWLNNSLLERRGRAMVMPWYCIAYNKWYKSLL